MNILVEWRNCNYKRIRQKDPMNLNGGGFRHCVFGDNVLMLCNRENELGISIWKSKNKGALGCYLVGATA